jgi:hypothetical protein
MQVVPSDEIQLLQQIEIVQLQKSALRALSRDELAHLVVILHDSPLPCAGIYPCDKVLHVPSDEHCGVGNGLGADADVALLYGANGLLVS